MAETSFAGRFVLVTGGSRGIGAALVRSFAGAGAQVAFCYKTSVGAANALLQEFEPGQVWAIRADVSRPEEVDALFAQAERLAGKSPDTLICNAGIAQQKLFTDLTDEDWTRMLGTNLSGPFYCCRRALPAMIRQKWGRILLVGSMWGQVGGSCEAHYSAAKAGLIGLGKALAKEEGPSGITVNVLAPGVVDDDMMASFSRADKRALAEETPLGRLGVPEDVARAALWLAGEAGAFITGQVIGVNGGLVI